MKKVKVFFAVAALVVLSAGAFAAKAKFVQEPANDMYYFNGTTYTQIDASAPSAAANLVYYTASPTGTQVTISFDGGTTKLGLYDLEGSAPVHYYALY